MFVPETSSTPPVTIYEDQVGSGPASPLKETRALEEEDDRVNDLEDGLSREVDGEVRLARHLVRVIYIIIGPSSAKGT